MSSTAQEPRTKDHPASAFWPRCQLVLASHIPRQARYPVIDGHNHFWGDDEPGPLLRAMDETGVRLYINVTGNTRIYFDKGGYAIEPRDFSVFKRTVVDLHPGRFMACTMSGFAKWDDRPLFERDDFVERTIAQLESDAKLGACGLKVLKQLGLRFTDRDGSIVRIDDERLDPIWRRAGELGLPVLIHTADPAAFFDPIDKNNEHAITLERFPGWSFHGSRYTKLELLEQRNRMIARHPNTRFILPHAGGYPENLAAVARLLDECPNAHIDFAARIDELGRQPYTARDFMIQYQDRILFATDTPASAEVYRCYFRFLETRDECFEYPNYMGGWDMTRWKICGLYLPDEALKKIYYRNALRMYPGIDSGQFCG